MRRLWWVSNSSVPQKIKSGLQNSCMDIEDQKELFRSNMLGNNRILKVKHYLKNNNNYRLTLSILFV